MTKQKEEALEVEGTVTQALANTRFRVEIEGGHVVMAHVAGRMRKHFTIELRLDTRTHPRLADALQPFPWMMGWQAGLSTDARVH